MKANAINSWIASFGLHIIFLAAIAITWKPQISSNPDPAISVDIISNFASSLGPESKIDIESTNIDPSENPLPATKDEKAIAEPNLNITNNEVIPTPKPQTIQQAKPTETPPKPIEKILPKQNKAAITKPEIKKETNDFPFQFDLAAATKASSGVNSGGVKTPKLSNSGIVAKGNSKGGGAKLQGDLIGILSEQVKPCWAEPADLSDPQSLLVELEIELSPNGNLRKPPKLVYPQSKSGASASLLVAIDNAVRAARQCAPFVLPSERYEEWQKFSFRFDPKKLRQK